MPGALAQDERRGDGGLNRRPSGKDRLERQGGYDANEGMLLGTALGEPRPQVAGEGSGEDFFLARDRPLAGVAVSVPLVVETPVWLRREGPLRRKRMQRC